MSIPFSRASLRASGEALTRPSGRAGASATAAVAASAVAAPAGEVEEIERTSIRKTIARRLTEAWQAPVFQLTVSVDMTRSLELRERLVGRLREGETKPTVSDLLTKVSAAALLRHPAVNAHFTGDKILRFPAAHGAALAGQAHAKTISFARITKRARRRDRARRRRGRRAARPMPRLRSSGGCDGAGTDAPSGPRRRR